MTKLLEDKLANLKDTMPKDEPHLKPLMDKRKLKRHQFNNQIASLIYWQVLGQGEICLDPVRVTLKVRISEALEVEYRRIDQTILEWTTVLVVAGEAGRELTRVKFICRSGPLVGI